METKELSKLTFGEQAVGLSFNPGGDENVNKIKKLYAQVIDLLNKFRTSEQNGQNRLIHIAITEAQGAQMWGVKAITWKD